MRPSLLSGRHDSARAASDEGWMNTALINAAVAQASSV